MKKKEKMSNPKEVVFSWKDYQEMLSEIEQKNTLLDLIKDMQAAGVGFTGIDRYEKLIIETGDYVSDFRFIVKGVL